MNRIDVVLEFFQRVVPQQQRSLEKIIEQAGGADVALGRAEVMRDLLNRECKLGDNSKATAYDSTFRQAGVPSVSDTSQHYIPPGGQRRRQERTYYYPPRARWQSYGQQLPYSSQQDYDRTPQPLYPGRPSETDNTPTIPGLASLQEELADSPADSIAKNSEAFDRKFTVMERNITAEMRRIVGREGDRVIGAVLAGPHERILDPVSTLLLCYHVLKMLIVAT